MRALIRAVMLTVATAAAMAIAQPAYAAPPPNDTPAGATVIGALPFSDSVTIDEATTDALDAALNANCGAPATEGSVWYRFDATQDGAVLFDVSQSSFTAGVVATVGDPADGDLVACSPDGAIFDVAAGQSYYVMAFSDTPGVTTGTLVVHADVPPPPPQIDIAVDPTGRFNAKTGAATITGTVTCQDADAVFLDVELRQSVGRFTISGYGSTAAACDGTAQPWSAEVLPSNGRFAGGRTVSVVVGFACGPFSCGESSQEATVKLRGR